MTPIRKGESEPQPRFRESRFFHSMDEWFFVTRERTVEGPFKYRVEAEKMLEAYLNWLDATVHIINNRSGNVHSLLSVKN
jgi:hypothetical protein